MSTTTQRSHDHEKELVRDTIIAGAGARYRSRCLPAATANTGLHSRSGQRSYLRACTGKRTRTRYPP